MELHNVNLMDSGGMHSEFYVEDFVNVCKRCSGMQKNGNGKIIIFLPSTKKNIIIILIIVTIPL